MNISGEEKGKLTFFTLNIKYQQMFGESSCCSSWSSECRSAQGRFYYVVYEFESGEGEEDGSLLRVVRGQLMRWQLRGGRLKIRATTVDMYQQHS